MRILVTGAAGLLGHSLVPVLSRSHDVTAVDVADFDITDLGATVRSIKAAAPDAVVHCAAWADVDGAETHGDDAFRVNGIGTKNVVLAANEARARIVQISTDYVFDGHTDRPYVESDPVNPVGVYANSKWMAEQTVRELADRFTVIRTQALYGPHGPSFPKAILARVEKGEPLRVVDDQTICPTRTADLSEAILRIVDEGTEGIYHASSRGECTWFEYAKEILDACGKPDHPLTPIGSDELDRPAPRPPYSVLRNLHLELTIGDPFPTWNEALRIHMEEVR